MVEQPRFDEVVGYLQAQGWAPQVPWRNGRVWSHGEFDVLVPGVQAADFAARMRALVRCVADFEQREPEVVVRDIVSGGVDVVGYRAGDGDSEVSLEAGTAALAALHTLIVACARQVADREIRKSSMRELAVAEMLDSTTLLPHREVFGYDVFLSGPGSRLGRSSAVRLLDVAATMQEAARGEGPAGFGLAREIRYETVEAFGALGSADHGAMRFELSFRWSRQVRRPDVAVEFSRATVSRLPQLRDASGESRIFTDRLEPPHPAELPTTDRPDQELLGGEYRVELPRAERSAVIVGVVVGLDKDGGLKAIVRGVLSVDGTSTGRQRRITVRLRTADEYTKALAAHSSEVRVRATGTFDGKRDLQISENGFTVIEGDGS
ncbi:hypothetical protein ACFWUP_27680 [Nocardia sp. NPDC058658]|uniref:hypothetical protein n=1 Tax=Nocardia sp. NPDC058658 TaxID=3346580 RepID=UPI003649BC1B